MTDDIEISVQIGGGVASPPHCDRPCSSSSSAGILVGDVPLEGRTHRHGQQQHQHQSRNSLLISSTTEDKATDEEGKRRRAKANGKDGATQRGDTELQQQDNSTADMTFYLSDSSTSCCSSSCPSSASCHPPDGDEEHKVPCAEMAKSIAEGEEEQKTLWQPIRPDAKLKVRTLGLMAAILPAIGCYFCLAYTFAFQFDRVANFTIPSSFCPGLKSMFPPVSYSIGVWKPQKYIWLMVLTLHIPPRFFYSIVHKCHYAMGESEFRQRRWFPKIRRLHYILLVVEALGLLAVSVIDIESHFQVHAVCFALWLIPFNFNMLFNNIIHYHSGINQLKTMCLFKFICGIRFHDRVFRIKCALFLLGYPISVSTAISYTTFLLTCSTFAYATFSLAEYFLIGINSIFYFLIVWEFEGSKVEVYIKHRAPTSPTAAENRRTDGTHSR